MCTNILMISKTYMRLHNKEKAVEFLQKTLEFKILTPDDEQVGFSVIQQVMLLIEKFALLYLGYDQQPIHFGNNLLQKNAIQLNFKRTLVHYFDYICNSDIIVFIIKNN